jgi:hypothetical protein
MLLNTPSAALYSAPVFIAQGGADTIILPQTNRAFVERLCAVGNTVQYNLYEGADHLGVVKSSNADVLAWLAALAGNEDAPSNCPKPEPGATNMPTATPQAVNPFNPADRVIFSDGPFIPDIAIVAELESRLPAFLRQNQDKFSELKPPIVERLSTYKRQYWGEMENGKQLIHVNALCTEVTNWRTQRVYIMDGGDCFFTVLYDAATKTFFNLSVNGEA